VQAICKRAASRAREPLTPQPLSTKAASPLRALAFLSPPAAAALTLICASCGSSTTPKPALGVLSSISDGAALSNALQWKARPVGVADANVARVEFVIDARVRWTEQHPPYVFNGDGNELFPSVLGQGAHRLAVRVVTSSGKQASTSASVTISDPISVPPQLAGTFTRDVTAADVRRTQTFRHEPADQVLPAGIWRLWIARRGVITFDDPRGSGGNEAFSATPGGAITLQGPANWLLPPDRQGSFCGVEPIGAYSWVTHAGRLTLIPGHDRCADRNSMFAGDWKRT
jgi:hypothetical protein